MENSSKKNDTWLKGQMNLIYKTRVAEEEFDKHGDYYKREDAIETIRTRHAQAEYRRVNEAKARTEYEGE